MKSIEKANSLANQSNMDLEKWIPFFADLIWPVFILLVILIFRSHIKTAFKAVLDAVKEGRSFQVGDWFQIGEKTTVQQLESDGSKNLSGGMEMTVSNIGGMDSFTTKASSIFLEKLKDQIRKNPNKRIEVLLLSDEIRYSLRLLKEYINSLSIKFIVFIERDLFAGWVESPHLISQLPSTNNDIITYRELKSEIIGISVDYISENTSAVDALKKMETINKDNIAVVDSGKFKFMVNSGNMISRLLTKSLTESQTKKSKNISNKALAADS